MSFLLRFLKFAAFIAVLSLVYIPVEKWFYLQKRYQNRRSRKFRMLMQAVTVAGIAAMPLSMAVSGSDVGFMLSGTPFWFALLVMDG